MLAVVVVVSWWCRRLRKVVVSDYKGSVMAGGVVVDSPVLLLASGVVVESPVLFLAGGVVVESPVLLLAGVAVVSCWGWCSRLRRLLQEPA